MDELMALGQPPRPHKKKRALQREWQLRLYKRKWHLFEQYISRQTTRTMSPNMLLNTRWSSRINSTQRLGWGIHGDHSIRSTTKWSRTYNGEVTKLCKISSVWIGVGPGKISLGCSKLLAKWTKQSKGRTSKDDRSILDCSKTSGCKLVEKDSLQACAEDDE